MSHVSRNVLSYEGSLALDKPLSISELYDALKNMRMGAVPGEDGLTVEFYEKFWPIIQNYVYSSFVYAFDKGVLSISQRKGIIKLIPKKNKDPQLIPSWRPITLLNVDYKILTKVFSRRLAGFLPELIHHDQKGFIRHRDIHENILDIQAIISACDSNDSEAMLLMLDIEKAFDSISWDFLSAVFRQFGFPESFLQWFKVFYSGKELYIINQGQLSEVIFPERGVAQGCGISPLYFILGIEVLALAVREDPRIEGITMFGASKKISLLADDGILALRWAKSILDAVKEVLDEFHVVSNLQVNPLKSLIIPIGPRSHNRSSLEAEQSFPHESREYFHYLGTDIPLHRNLTIVENHLNMVMVKIKQIAEKRSSPDHSILGRILTVKQLMLSRFIYTLMHAPSPSPMV